MQTALTYRTNRDLFSNHYLDEHLPETEEWDEVSDEELQEAYDDIMALWEREKDTAPKRNESQLEEKFIRPMFRKLGIPFEVEESTSRTQRRPDYGFFETEEAARSAFERRDEGGDFYRNAVAVADAKRWGRPLDTRGSGEHERDFENPSYQIHVYLQEVDDAQWAVLTDGKKWRLYYGPTSHRLDSYYEVDLPTILESGDLEDFKYFYLFFRHEAFLEDGSGDCFLDDVYDESNVFAQELGEDLQDNIYEAIKILSEGYLQYPENDLNEDDLDLIHDSSLIYLYRLIFVLYAEAEGRELLDTSNEIYEQTYSLNSLKQEVAEEIESGDPKYRDWQDNLQSRLDELFTLIDKGSKSRGIPGEDLYIPAYNGGLFRTDPDEDDSAEAKFLANHDVGDAYLAKVVELLTRSKNNDGGGKIFVDYSSLDVRHLGSIYEGLLEYQLNVADEPLALDDGEYVSADEDDDIVVQEGEVYLTTDSGERKATGSYYTPEYVVEYIVENTLGPLVEDIREDLAGQTAHGEGGFAGEFADRIFELKVLDPAMGSGHFLTSAVDYLAREIIDAQEKQAAQEGIQTVDEQQDINWARRQVAQRCIYGVDLNPLAVELAKVSLWLRTLAAEQPLAFLDHHLKAGNSLVGSDIETVLDNGDPDNGTEEGQLTLQESFNRTRRQALEHVTDQFENLLAIDNQTLDDIKEMEAVYEEARDDPLYQNLISMANVHTAEQFGLDVPVDAYERMAEALRDNSWGTIEGQDWYQSAQAMAEDQRFFHWELEFPIAFYEQGGELKEDGGFDAVIGNPPWGHPGDNKEYLKNEYMEVVKRLPDTFSYFSYKSLKLCTAESNYGAILPNVSLFQSEYTKLRDELLNSGLYQVIDLGEGVFDDAVAPSAILLCSQNKSVNELSIRNLRNSDLDRLSQDVKDTKQFPVQDIRSEEDLVIPTYKIETRELLAELRRRWERLGDQFNIEQGVQTGGDEAFTVTEDEIEKYELESEFLRPVLFGSDIVPYKIFESDKYLLYIGRNIEKSEIPNILSYLEQYRDDLESVSEVRKGIRPWYTLHRPRDPAMFEGEHALLRQTGDTLIGAVDQHERYTVDSLLCVSPKNDTAKVDILTLLLNSSLLRELYDSITQESGRVFSQVKPQNVKKLALPPSDEMHLDQAYTAEVNDQMPEPVDSVSDLPQVYNVRESLSAKRHSLNLNLFDYLGIPSNELPDSKAGETLGDLEMPAAGVADTPLSKTTEEYEGLRIESVSFAEYGGRLVLAADISYKVEDDDPRETDRWDRLAESEFETYEAMTFVNLSKIEEMLMREFVPIAVEEADGFAGFRQDATKTNSLLDRLKDLTLPDIAEVQTGLEQYIEVRERADDLNEKIEKADLLIDEIVYDLYGLTDEEIKIVESAVQDD
ncbi:Eco57I restriction-modification methylase domain-containing protein [Halobacterium salinarum]|uniref:Eco57I restriction-modification methylase domain-containing protein n=1 Tax=Halobacterium salinarum TaxID=2242 RepID=UPI0025523D45|nr:TaqI-like C-terminal specificity domain-containing protein [Halobacterium salinarum]MDL0134873.1 TaqI-like C-terminal specificity domain-containing protein [Halobacterium salinarum]